MHPSFASLFVHPRTHKPLVFFGDVEDGEGIPFMVLYPNQSLPEEFLQELGRFQEERWIKNRWKNGYLFAYEEPEMYPVINGIPIFTKHMTWPPICVKWLLQGEHIKKSWERSLSRFPVNSTMSEFIERMAETDGLILDIASGPAGGFAPMVLQKNPEAKVLMDDLGLGVLQEWQRFLKSISIRNVSFALFDAKEIPLMSNSIDFISDIWGFTEIGSDEAIKEAYRILKSGGAVFSIDSVVEKEDFFKIPEEVRMKWLNKNPLFFDGFLDSFKKSGFKVVSNDILRERALSPDEGEQPKEAEKYGVRLHVKEYITELIKE